MWWFFSFCIANLHLFLKHSNNVEFYQKCMHTYQNTHHTYIPKHIKCTHWHKQHFFVHWYVFWASEEVICALVSNNTTGSTHSALYSGWYMPSSDLQITTSCKSLCVNDSLKLVICWQVNSFWYDLRGERVFHRNLRSCDSLRLLCTWYAVLEVMKRCCGHDTQCTKCDLYVL